MASLQRAAMEALGIAVAARVPVLLWGGPGTGKSSAVQSLAIALDVPCEVVIASIREPSDFAGLPIVSNGTVRFAPPRWAQHLATASKGILFLDEISTTPPAVQAALLRVVLERVVGDLELPMGVVVIAAANPPEQTADGWDLSAPLANRFCHIDWVPEAAAFSEGITAGWPTPTVAILPTEWEERATTAYSLIGAFVQIRPNLLSSVPRDASAAGRAWPSPRSWEMAARLCAACAEASASDAARNLLVSGSVGPGAAAEFLTWASDMDLGDPEDALRNPDAFELPIRGDRAYAALSAVAAAVAANPTPERWIAGWKILDTAGSEALDIAAVAARTLIRCRPNGIDPPNTIKRFTPLFEEADIL
jgi:hypothetical protein